MLLGVAEIHHEVELGVIIGKVVQLALVDVMVTVWFPRQAGRDIPASKAMQHVGGACPALCCAKRCPFAD